MGDILPDLQAGINGLQICIQQQGGVGILLPEAALDPVQHHLAILICGHGQQDHELAHAIAGINIALTERTADACGELFHRIG